MHSIYISIAITFLRNRGSDFSSFMTKATIAGIIISVSSLIIIVSIMNGFEKQIIERTLRVVPEIEVITANERDVDRIRNVVGVQRAEVIQESRAVVRAGQQLSGVKVISVYPENLLSLNILDGKEDSILDDKYIGIGIELSKELGISTGGRVALMYQDENSRPKTKSLKVGFVFEVGSHTYDRNVVITSMNLSKAMKSDANFSIGIVTEKDVNLEITKENLIDEMNCGDCVRSWKDKNKNIMAALKTEKRVMMIVMTLVVLITMFNLVVSLMMIIKDKSSDISTLKALGYNKTDIVYIFIVQGVVLGGLATTIGMILGIVVSLNIEYIVSAIEYIMGAEILNSDVYYISEIVSDIRFNEIIIFYVMSIVFSIVATVIPAKMASNIEVAKGLKG